LRPFGIGLVLLGAAAAYAQVGIDPARYRPLVRYLDPQPGETRFACSVAAVRPTLNFSLRFQGGYAVRVPMAQFTGAGHRWHVVLEVAPVEGGHPFYFGQDIPLPKVPPTKSRAEFEGGYLIGEGQYHARLAMLDEHWRVCRSQWNIDVRPKLSERRVELTMPPHTVSEFTWENVLHLGRNAADATSRNLTILLDVAPLVQYRTRLRPGDHFVLLALLSAVLERVKARNVRLVAFSLDQQREIFRRDSLAPGDLQQLAHEMETLELGTVDYHILQNRIGYKSLLARLVDEQMAASPPSESVLFVGPGVRYLDKMPAAALPQPTDTGPHFYYFQYRPIFRQPRPFLPDILDSVVSRMKGKAFEIRTPADFEKAIDHVNQAGAAQPE
jgi:hypothetical protein